MENKYKLRARFSKSAETPIGPLISYIYKMKDTRKEREMEFNHNLSLDEIKQKIKKHYKDHNGEINFFGDILYYEFYENGNILYTFDVEGNIIQTEKFLDSEYKKNYYEYYKIIEKIINEVDPFNIAWVAEDEYEPEIKDLAEKMIGKSLNKKGIFKITKKVFDSWFYEKEENIPKYWEIAQKIFDELKEKYDNSK